MPTPCAPPSNLCPPPTPHRVLQVNVALLVSPVPKVPPVTLDVLESLGCPERG